MKIRTKTALSGLIILLFPLTFLPSTGSISANLSPSRASVFGICTKSDPCPMGVVDYGRNGTSNYSYSTSTFVSWANFTSLEIDGGAKGASISIQQNLVIRIVYENGIRQVYWVQDVPFITQSGKIFRFQEVDNIWNFSSPSADMAGKIHHNLLGQCNGQKDGQPTFYGCFSYPNQYNFNTSLPFEVLMNTTTFVLNSGHYNGTTAVKFGIWIYHKNKLVNGQWFDEVAFLGKAGKTAPGFHVDYTNRNPFGSYYDAETVICGPGDGLSQVITKISAHVSESFIANGSLKPVPHAYSAGSDTAETVSGVNLSGSAMTGKASSGADDWKQLW